MAVVDLVVKLRDQATAGIRGIGSALSGLSSSTASAATQTQGFAGALTQGILQANAVQFAIGKATEAMGGFQKAFGEAQQLQVSGLTAANTFATQTGKSLAEGEAVVDRLNQRLAVSAAALPGTTQDYKNLAIQVQDNLIPAFKQAGGAFDTKGFEDAVFKISESFGVLGATGGAATSDINLFLTKALAGSSEASLRILKFAETQPSVLGNIKEELTKVGQESLDKVDISKRIDILRKVGEKAITKEFKEKASATVEGLVQTYKSGLFDPTTGLFGLMRDLEPNTQGAQTVFNEFNTSLNLLIGSNGILGQFTQLMGTLGLTFDPMSVLRQGVVVFNSFLTGFNKQLTAINTFATVTKEALSLGTISFEDIAFTIWQAFDLRYLADSAAKFIFSIGTGFQGMLLRAGNQGAALFNLGVTILSDSLADPLVFYRLGDTLGNVLGRAFGALYNFLAQVDYGKLLMAIGRAAIAIFVGLAGFANGANEGVSVAMQDALGMMLSSLGDSLKYLILSFTDPIGEQFNAMGSSLGNSANSLINGLKTTIGETVNQAGAAATSFGKSVLEGAVELASGIGSALSQGFQSYLGYLQQQIPVRIAMGTLAVLGTLAQVTGRVVDALATNIGQVVEGWKNEATAAATQAFDRLTLDFANLYATYITPVSNSANQAMNSAGASIQSGILAYNGFIDSMSQSVYLALEAGAGLVSAFGASINGYINQGLSLLRGAWESYSSGVSALGIEISAQLQPPIDAALKMVADIANAISGLVNAGARMVQSAQNAVNSFNPVPAIQSNIQSAGDTAVGAINNLFGGAKFSGHVAGNAAGGFLGDLVGAARSEMSAMPSGAKLLVANTTEHIIPKGMLGGLMSAIAPASASAPTPIALPMAAAPVRSSPRSGGNTFNLNFPGASGDPSAIASAVMAAIESAFESESGAQLG